LERVDKRAELVLIDLGAEIYGGGAERESWSLGPGKQNFDSAATAGHWVII
jgi:hypothetical protein